MHNISAVRSSTNLLTSCILYSSMAHLRFFFFHVCVLSSLARELWEIIFKSLKWTLSSVQGNFTRSTLSRSREYNQAHCVGQ